MAIHIHIHNSRMTKDVNGTFVMNFKGHKIYKDSTGYSVYAPDGSGLASDLASLSEAKQIITYQVD